MATKFALLFFAFTVAGSFAQSGFFGPISTKLKARDFAPNLAFTKVLHAASAVPWSVSNLSGAVTVLVFFPDTSHNLESVSRWNALIEEFGGKPVQFVWITAEKESSLLPWLKKHPVNGWVFHDPDGQTARLFGLERPQAVFIGADARIVGFGDMQPTEDTVNAVLEGRITTTPVAPTRVAMKAFFESRLVLLSAEPEPMFSAQDHKPDFAPSYRLHVSPTRHELGGGNFSGPDYWSLQDFDLGSLLSEITGVNRIRIELPAALEDGKRYDFAIVLPAPEKRENMCRLIQRGIEEQFHITETRENRLRDVYVVTAADGKLRASKASRLGGSSSLGYYYTETVSKGEDPDIEPIVGSRAVDIDAVSNIWMDGTIEEFCHLLESGLGRPVVNETGLNGKFQFRVKENKVPANDFVERLRDQLGLVVTRAQREVETVVFRPRE
jgi:uncharacterized protein (TIGR03435 family)